MTDTKTHATNLKEVAIALGLTQGAVKKLKDHPNWPGGPPYDLSIIRNLDAAEPPETEPTTAETTDPESGSGEIVVALNDDECATLAKMSEEADLPQDRVMIQALRTYELFRAGELQPVNSGLTKSAATADGFQLDLPLDDGGQQPSFLFIQKRLSTPLAQVGFHKIYHGLRNSHARLADGSHVDTPGDVVQFICEQAVS